MRLWPGQRKKEANEPLRVTPKVPNFELSSDPNEARGELFGLIFYLTTFSYIDGEFDDQETAYIRSTIRTVIDRWVRASYTTDVADGPEAADEVETMVQQDASFFTGLFEAVQQEVEELLNNSVAEAEAMHVFLGCKLKQRCFEIFKSFNAEQQEQLLAVADELLMADGLAHPAEVHLRRELTGILKSAHAPPLPAEVPELIRHNITIDDRVIRDHGALAPEAFYKFEYPWSEDREVRLHQANADRNLLNRALLSLEKMRKNGRGKLRGVTRVDELVHEQPFLDGYVHVVMPQKGRKYELTVIGDLHGCYSCLKAVLMQSQFFEKVSAFRRDPENYPEPKLVLLGDYIDRGRFSLDGVLRLVLQLQNTAPEHVYMLRGNHEIFVEEDGDVKSVVTPADTLESIREIASPDLLKDYRKVFDGIPNTLIFGRLLFTHAGIPSDSVIKTTYRDLSSLNDPDIRFQMMWSDPSIVDVMPMVLQDQLVRFSFGRLQCQSFLQRFGCHTMIRGHGLVATGFRTNYYDDDIVVMTLCSAGGPDNQDLPEICELRLVRPMAITMTCTGGIDGEYSFEVWPIDYTPYTVPERNGFYR